MRRELRRLCALAGVTPFLAHSIRRRAGTEYERAHEGCGPLILGHTLDSAQMSFDHYIDPVEILTIAASRLIQPAAFTQQPGCSPQPGGWLNQEGLGI